MFGRQSIYVQKFQERKGYHRKVENPEDKKPGADEWPSQAVGADWAANTSEPRTCAKVWPFPSQLAGDVWTISPK